MRSFLSLHMWQFTSQAERRRHWVANTARVAIPTALAAAAPLAYMVRRAVKRRLNFTPSRSSKKMRRSQINMRKGGYLGKSELKFVDAYRSTALATDLTDVNTLINPGGAGGDNNLVPIPIGTGESQRVGRCAYIRSIYIKGHVQVSILNNSANAAHPSFYATLWVVMDKQSNAAPMTPATFLNQVGVPPNHDADAMQNLQYSDRYKLLKKIRIRVNMPGVGSTGANLHSQPGASVPFEAYIPLKTPIKQEYKSTGGAITDMTTHSIHMVGLKSTESPPVVTIRYLARSRYTD